jgi:hypothetical protein
MPKPTKEASLTERNEDNIYDFLTNLKAMDGFYDKHDIKTRSGLSEESLAAIKNGDIQKISLADILGYANATNSYLDLNTDLDS